MCLRTGRFARPSRRGGRVQQGLEITRWRDAAEALEAERVLCDPRCGPSCESRHSIVWADGLSMHVRAGVNDVPPPSLADEFAALYPRQLYEPEPEAWSAPAEMNEPLEKPVGTSALAERVTNGQRLAWAQALAEAATVRPL